ncbi:hypothetical protein SeLEV6574_g01231 [Synchytrium endobioticum]|uniref:Uncharacterized protein n=1 Tax=Synchytrium endobioticum TaxID=286115 RepID=A0A507DG26_9FUNG|nr:hypothetical protein SeLEV6574_g01231 [Synchytrium endobioticum]
MSRNSKIALAASIVFTTATISFVYYLKDAEVKVRRVGIERDDERRRRKREVAGHVPGSDSSPGVAAQAVPTTPSPPSATAGAGAGTATVEVVGRYNT